MRKRSGLTSKNGPITNTENGPINYHVNGPARETDFIEVVKKLCGRVLSPADGHAICSRIGTGAEDASFWVSRDYLPPPEHPPGVARSGYHVMAHVDEGAHHGDWYTLL
jgi:hypothetical protein